MYKNIILLIFMFNAHWLIAQNIEQVLFEGLCKSIIQNDKYFYLRYKLAEQVFAIIDPETYDSTIVYVEGIDTCNEYIESFKRYSKEEQFDIMNEARIPVFMSNDTLFILDTVSFFSTTMEFKFGEAFFRTIRHTHTGIQYVCLSSFVRFRKGCIELYLSGGSLKDLVGTCHIKLDDSLLKIHKAFFAKRGTSNE
jgi:hypothetical protein